MLRGGGWEDKRLRADLFVLRASVSCDILESASLKLVKSSSEYEGSFLRTSDSVLLNEEIGLPEDNWFPMVGAWF